MKLTEAQKRKLALAPAEWDKMPTFGDSRSIAPLLRLGVIEERHIDVTDPAEPLPWLRMVRIEWRITPAGRAALEKP